MPKALAGSLTYQFSRGIHQFRTRNINAPQADGTCPRGKIEQSAHWEGNRLVNVTQMGEDMKLTESYERIGEQLIVTTTMEIARFGKPLSLRRVYDRANP